MTTFTNRFPSLLPLLLFSFSTVLLSACGNTGPLYLPQDEGTPATVETSDPEPDETDEEDQSDPGSGS